MTFFYHQATMNYLYDYTQHKYNTKHFKHKKPIFLPQRFIRFLFIKIWI